MAAARFPWYWPEDAHRGWQSLRRRGPVYVVLVRGVLAWGGFMFICSLLMTLLGIVHREFFLGELLKTASICVLGGLLWGVSTWCFSEWAVPKI